MLQCRGVDTQNLETQKFIFIDVSANKAPCIQHQPKYPRNIELKFVV